MAFGKWIGGGLGWALGGPLGALVGFAVGSMFDKASVATVAQEAHTSRYRHHTTSDDFSMSLLVLSAAVMKADGKVLRSELEYVKKFFNQQFGARYTAAQMKVLQELLKKEIPVRQVCEQIRYNMEHPLRLQLLHYLYGISKADGHVDKKEVQVIEQIAYYLGISAKDMGSIKAMFYKETASSYKILEIEKSATDDELKKAYRRMAVKHHPDKVSHLGEEFRKAAKEKFLKVQEAYESIKKERGLS